MFCALPSLLGRTGSNLLIIGLRIYVGWDAPLISFANDWLRTLGCTSQQNGWEDFNLFINLFFNCISDNRMDGWMVRV